MRYLITEPFIVKLSFSDAGKVKNFEVYSEEPSAEYWAGYDDQPEPPPTVALDAEKSYRFSTDDDRYLYFHRGKGSHGFVHALEKTRDDFSADIIVPNGLSFLAPLATPEVAVEIGETATSPHGGDDTTAPTPELPLSETAVSEPLGLGGPGGAPDGAPPSPPPSDVTGTDDLALVLPPVGMDPSIDQARHAFLLLNKDITIQEAEDAGAWFVPPKYSAFANKIIWRLQRLGFTGNVTDLQQLERLASASADTSPDSELS
jgi:hypothetical protein